MEKLDRAQKCSILGPQNMGLEGLGPLPPTPRSAPEQGSYWPRLAIVAINIASIQ